MTLTWLLQHKLICHSKEKISFLPTDFLLVTAHVVLLSCDNENQSWVHALKFRATVLFTVTSTSVSCSFPDILVLSLCAFKSKFSVMLIHLFSESTKMYGDAKGRGFILVQDKRNSGWCKFWKPQQWASLGNDHSLRFCSLSLVFHEPSSTNFEVSLSFRWNSGICIGESHSKRGRKKKQTQYDLMSWKLCWADTEDLWEMSLWKKEAAELESNTSKWLPLSLWLWLLLKQQQQEWEYFPGSNQYGKS